MPGKTSFLRIPLAVLLLLGVCLSAAPCAFSSESVNSADDTAVLRAASQVMAALQARDGDKFASLVHPRKGVRFSAYAFVDAKNDRKFSRAQAKRFWTDRKKYIWGYQDGSGDPIKMTPNQYYRRYVFDRDFTRSTSVSINNDTTRGTTMNNAASEYPGSKRVEYFIEGTDESKMDWAALRLVFERLGDSWYLVGVIHDEWTT